MAEPMISARNIFKAYPRAADAPALRGVTFSLPRGQFAALSGPSGCGKSTLLNLLACVDTPTSGEMLIDGRDVSRLSDDDLTLVRRTSIGYVFQFFNLMPTMTVRENVELPLLLGGWPKGRSRQAVDDVLAEIGIAELSAYRPLDLSGGQQQRVAIARAVVHGPKLLLADEPTGNLDSKTGAQVLALLRRLCSARGMTVLLATHNEDAAAAADRTLRMRDGVLQ